MDQQDSLVTKVLLEKEDYLVQSETKDFQEIKARLGRGVQMEKSGKVEILEFKALKEHQALLVNKEKLARQETLDKWVLLALRAKLVEREKMEKLELKAHPVKKDQMERMA